MRVCDRLSAVVVALAFVLAGLGAPACAEAHLPGAVVTAAHRSIAHDASHVVPPDVRRIVAPVAAPHPAAPPSGDLRVVGERHAHPDTPPELRAEVPGGPCGDHRAGVGQADGPDDLLLGAPLRVDGTTVAVLAATPYRPPVVPLPPRGTLLTRAPPATA
ncbi:hypothetical protein U2F26_23590 [Micromonospora sp. 4G57]|uniref:Uncharacterized protein n=1 Tax=Micromonospora sicca TaxID=2202420 RepID=A0ABU5JBY8_9ACTN|nr:MULTISPECIES: hypothetical protein [unclassified Micromonospora]MDZ5445680.1 hypothetical protein [Micromonospora sp. 4G57]MDZ5490098.1 hypothetical protein [Micromonospora sp. 4G53]